MPNLSTEGNFHVRIVNGVVKPRPTSEDPKAFNVSLKCETPDGFHAWYELWYNKKVFASKKHGNITSTEDSTIKLKELGVKDGYLGNLQSAIEAGLEAEIVMKYDEFTNKEGKMERILRAKFLNPPRKTIDLKDANWDELLSDAAATDAQPATTSTEETAKEPQDAEEIPF